MQIIKKHHERMLWSRQRSDELLKHALKSVQRFRRAEDRRWLLAADNQRHFRDDLHEDAAVWTQSL